MSHTPAGLPQGWENKLADRSSLPPVPGEERQRHQFYVKEHADTHRHHVGGKADAKSLSRCSSAGGCSSSSGGAGTGTASGGSDPPRLPPRSPPAHLRWARDLHHLLQDAEGVRLFQRFLREGGPPHTDRLDFYFACRGLKQEKDPQRVKSMVTAIYRFLRKSQLTIPEELKRRIKQGMRGEEALDAGIFDSMQAEVERVIKETTYINFLKSDLYIQHAQAHNSSSSSTASSSKEVCWPVSAGALATLHEGEELSLQSPGPSLCPPCPPPAHRLTRDLLMATQSRRLQTETFSGGPHRKNYSVYSHAHLSYASYCPASNQDSEAQSMSSGRTDSMSGSSVDGMSHCRGHNMRREYRSNQRAIIESANINRDPHVHENMIFPRTLRLQKGQGVVMKPEEFAPLLIEKLKKVKQDMDNDEKVKRNFMENDDVPGQAIPPNMVAAAIREKLQLEDDNDQDILDQHVSRVWSDLTPARSPGVRPAPRPQPPSPPPRRAPPPPSTLSAQSQDSGNVRDFGEATSSGRSADMSRQTLARRSLSRKTLTDLTDSGVSVVSDSLPVHPITQPHNSRIHMWVQESASNTDRHGRRSFSPGERPGQPVATDPQMPPLPSPHTPTQLDEARRRLMLGQSSTGAPAPPPLLPRHNKRWSGVPGVSGKPAVCTAPPWQQQQQQQQADSACTVVVFTFLEEKVPYRTKIPAAPVTLKQFKECLPKKGNYRYFFKTECEELENSVIQEEIFNDGDNLPLWEGKIMAKVKNIE